MPPLLLVFASKHGHTAKVASVIASALEEAGHTVTVRDTHTVGRLRAGDYAGVIVGASVHTGHHQHQIVSWAGDQAAVLNAVPSAFFSLCLAAAEDTDESRLTAQGYLDDFARDTGWSPDRAVSFAGALQYREYDAPTRLLMRLLMARGHHPTDTSRDYDYTDWNAVSAFARDVIELVDPAAARVGAPSD